MQSNIDRMQEFAAAHGVGVRPHVKTHKCVEVGRLQVEAGAVGITAGNVGEAEVFAAAGFDDIFLAYPVWPSGTRPAGSASWRRAPGSTSGWTTSRPSRPSPRRWATSPSGSRWWSRSTAARIGPERRQRPPATWLRGAGPWARAGRHLHLSGARVRGPGVPGACRTGPAGCVDGRRTQLRLGRGVCPGGQRRGRRPRCASPRAAPSPRCALASMSSATWTTPGSARARRTRSHCSSPPRWSATGCPAKPSSMSAPRPWAARAPRSGVRRGGRTAGGAGQAQRVPRLSCSAGAGGAAEPRHGAPCGAQSRLPGREQLRGARRHRCGRHCRGAMAGRCSRAPD